MSFLRVRPISVLGDNDQTSIWPDPESDPQGYQDSRLRAVPELARQLPDLGVPPPIVGHLQDSTFTNSETVGRWFASQTLRSWITKLEAEFTRSVFSDAARSQFELTWDLSALLRGDPELRWKSNQIAIDGGILTPNEVRLQEGWNAIQGGDVLRPARTTATAPA